MPRILLIDDEVNGSAFIKRELEKNPPGRRAYDGLTGQSLALQKDYDVLVLAIILPNRTGWEVCKSICSLS